MNHHIDEHKFKELLLYIADKSLNDSTFGATKLNKILCFADFITYGETGSPITGMEYQKLQWGPAPRRLLPLQKELIREGAAQLATAHYGHEQSRLVALRRPNLSSFSGTEIAIVDKVLTALKDVNGTEASDFSHDWFVGWDVVNELETIPYNTVFWRRPKVTPDLIEEGQKVAADL